MKRQLIITLKTLLVLLAFPFAFAAVVMFMLFTFGKMAVEKLVSAG